MRFAIDPVDPGEGFLYHLGRFVLVGVVVPDEEGEIFAADAAADDNKDSLLWFRE